jgi:hypothetical protein
VQSLWRTVLADLDLYALVIAGVAFTLLGAFGIADVKTLSSVTLALLAFLAFSQAKSRRLVALSAGASRFDGIFMAHFPPDIYSRRGTTRFAYFYIGISMFRTISVGRRDIEKMLERGASVRLLLVDPAREDLLAIVASQSGSTKNVEIVRTRIESSLAELNEIREAGWSGMQVRVMPFVPKFGANAFDMNRPDGVIYFQHYEYLPTGESAPIFRLEAKDGFWYQHHLAEMERIWAAAHDWNPPTQ